MSNDYRAYVECDYNSIYHHGVKGMKWGVRRYQNEDGTLTPEGRRKYGKLFDKYKKRGYSDGEALTMAKNSRSDGKKRAIAALGGLVGTTIGSVLINQGLEEQEMANILRRSSGIAQKTKLNKKTALGLALGLGSAAGAYGYLAYKAHKDAKNKKLNSNRVPDSYKSELKSRYDKVKKENPKWIKDNFGNDSFKSIINNDPDLLDMALDEYDLERKSKRR